MADHPEGVEKEAAAEAPKVPEPAGAAAAGAGAAVPQEAAAEAPKPVVVPRLKVREFPDPVLREKAVPVTVFDDALKTLVADMIQTMYAEEGVGLAAPQVGVSIRLAVLDTSAGEERGKSPFVIINPEILSREGELPWTEGCLSLPGIEVETQRSRKITVRSLDIDGHEVTIEAEGLASVAIQHEIDHLEGVLLFDHLSALKKRLAIRNYSRERKAERLAAREEE
jgi:peptide deformylase